MTVLEIKKYPDPVLSQKCEEVTVFDAALHRLLDDMAETMYRAQGIGLAASQVGILKQVAVVDISRESSKLIHLINPKIISSEGSVSSEEGCLSIPDYRDTLKRNKEIVVQAQDKDGKPFELHASELLAICIQHEVDHLNGILFTDRLSRLKKQLFLKWFKKHSFSHAE